MGCGLISATMGEVHIQLLLCSGRAAGVGHSWKHEALPSNIWPAEAAYRQDYRYQQRWTDYTLSRCFFLVGSAVVKLIYLLITGRATRKRYNLFFFRRIETEKNKCSLKWVHLMQRIMSFFIGDHVLATLIFKDSALNKDESVYCFSLFTFATSDHLKHSCHWSFWGACFSWVIQFCLKDKNKLEVGIKINNLSWTVCLLKSITWIHRILDSHRQYTSTLIMLAFIGCIIRT